MSVNSTSTSAGVYDWYNAYKAYDAASSGTELDAEEETEITESEAAETGAYEDTLAYRDLDDNLKDTDLGKKLKAGYTTVLNDDGTYTVDASTGEQNINFTYDEIGNILSAVSETIDSDGNVTYSEKNVYNADGSGVATIIDNNGNVTTKNFDSEGNTTEKITVISNGNLSSSLNYSDLYNIMTASGADVIHYESEEEDIYTVIYCDDDGTEYTATYDSTGKYVEGLPEEMSPVETLAYSDLDKNLKKSDLGQKLKKDKLEAVLNEDGSYTVDASTNEQNINFTYDENGKILSYLVEDIDADGSVTYSEKTVYNEDGSGVTTETKKNGNIATTKFDSEGNTTETTIVVLNGNLYSSLEGTELDTLMKEKGAGAIHYVSEEEDIYTVTYCDDDGVEHTATYSRNGEFISEELAQAETEIETEEATDEAQESAQAESEEETQSDDSNNVFIYSNLDDTLKETELGTKLNEGFEAVLNDDGTYTVDASTDEQNIKFVYDKNGRQLSSLTENIDSEGNVTSGAKIEYAEDGSRVQTLMYENGNITTMKINSEGDITEKSTVILNDNSAELPADSDLYNLVTEKGVDAIHDEIEDTYTVTYSDAGVEHTVTFDSTGKCVEDISENAEEDETETTIEEETGAETTVDADDEAETAVDAAATSEEETEDEETVPSVDDWQGMGEYIDELENHEDTTADEAETEAAAEEDAEAETTAGTSEEETKDEEINPSVHDWQGMFAYIDEIENAKDKDKDETDD